MPDKKRPKVDSPSVAKKSKGEDSSVGGSKNFNYDPVHFIRSHSKNNDPADIQTQIWEVGISSLTVNRKAFVNIDSFL